MTELIIHNRKALPEDVPRMLALVKELATYERAPHEVTITEEEFFNDGFGPHPAYTCWVAECNGVVRGMALCYVRYSTWKGRCLYLEDIVVEEAWRGQGIGKFLFEQVVAEAAAGDYAALVWQVLDWNEPALRFYARFGAQLDNGWINSKLNREQLRAYMQRKNPRKK
ncbi:MAG: GNAT family N-acetyltransferase [Flavobacteriales bacterium]|nr:GNAT family N-acetyltransferase [Flavobacteriales bacterium]